MSVCDMISYLLPGLEDGLDVCVEILSCEASHLETIVDSMCLLQLHDLLW